MSNVPAIQFTSTGLVIPQEAAVLAGVMADIDAAFGGGLNMSPATPQGQLATALAAIIADKNRQITSVINSLNPDTASGAYQDAIGRLYFLERKPGTPTTVQCDCVGGQGTLIPVGTRVSDTNGNDYICAQAGIIPNSGTISLPFTNVINGPTPCPSGTLTIISQAVPGFESINNPTDGVPGNFVESQSAYATRRALSVAINGQGPLQAVFASVFAVPGVIDAYAVENVTDSVIAFGATNYPLAPHSLYVAAIGGAVQDVATAIWLKKGMGANYNGNTTANVFDDNYDEPRPMYVVKYQIPASLPIKFEVRIRNSTSLPADIVMLVKAAVTQTFVGEDQEGQRVRIGSELLASKFYPNIIRIGPTVLVLSIKIGTTTPTLDSVLVGIDQAPTVVDADISVILV